jgi:hypothetical protein
MFVLPVPYFCILSPPSSSIRFLLIEKANVSLKHTYLIGRFREELVD